MKTFSRSIRRWLGNNQRERLSELRQPRKGRKKALSSIRPTFEVLEDRTLMSVPSPPMVLGQTDISTLTGNETMPVVAVDPLNPQKLVAAYEYTPTMNPADPFDSDHDQTTYVMASFSTDGGNNWSLFFNGTANYNLVDPAVMPSQANPYPALSSADSPSVAIDRNGNVYLVYE